MKTYLLVNNDQERAKYKELARIQRDEEGKEFLDIYEDDSHLIFYRLSKGITRDTENQTELPISALPWIARTIKDGFWRKPTDGGFDKNKHADRMIIDGEDILVSRTMNATYGNPGFKIANKSRQSHILKSISQEMSLPDELFESRLLELFSSYE